MYQCCFYHFIFNRKILSKIVSIATAVPAYKHQQEAIFLFADSLHSSNDIDSRKLKYLYHHSGIASRYSVLPDYSCGENDRQFYAKNKTLEPFPALEKRMECYAAHAGALSKIDSSQITHLITVSCTGMSAPGLDLEIMESMELGPSIFRTSINFMGCYAAIHALKLADAICYQNAAASVVIVCTELCTLHFQKDSSIDNLTSTLLFADGSAAVLVQPDASMHKGLVLQHFFSDVAFKGKKDMSWRLSSQGFLMTLSGYVPDLVEEDFDALLLKALTRAGLQKDAIHKWCIHPGGKKILEAIEKSTGLAHNHFHHSYEVLKNYGNMSSPTILFVLEKILQELTEQDNSQGQTVFGAAFGPGLTMETFIATYG
jgi:predicted naringenin-chalcone synthase